MNQVIKNNSSNCRLCNKSPLLIIKKYTANSNNLNLNINHNFSCSSVYDQNIQPSLYKCSNCGLIQIPLNKSPNNFLELYKDVVDKEYINNLSIKYKTSKKAFDLIKPLIKNLKTKYTNFEILDVGCYYGAFLKILQQNNIKATGIEPSKHASDYTKINSSQTILNTTLEDFGIKNNKTYHLITSWDVVEHVKDVDIYFKKINKLLKDDGVFVFSTIFIDSLIAKILGKYWHWIIPMHFSYFDKKSIKIAIEKNGFTQISLHNYKHYARVSYAIRGLSNHMPSLIKSILIFISNIIPQQLILPFSFGDVKIIIVKKKQNT